MADQTQQEIIVRLIADATNLIEGLKRATTATDSLQKNLVNLANQSKTSLDNAKKSVTELDSKLKGTQGTAQQTAGVFQRLGQAIQMALGIGLFQVISKSIALIQEMVKSTYDLAKAMYQLQIGINVLRRSGMDITLKEMYTNLDALQQKFGVFSKKELVEGAAAFANLMRDMGFTKEEFFELQDAVATLAVVNGRAMDEVQRTVALALSSGYTEGLQRLGVSINRVNIALKAEELGYGRVYMSLTEMQRAEATQILILEKTAKYMDDLEEYQTTAPGQIDRMTAAWKDFKATLLSGILPYLGAFASGIEALLKWMGKVSLIKFWADSLGVLGTALGNVVPAIKILIDAGMTWQEKGEAIIELNKKLADSFIRLGLSVMSAVMPNLAKQYEEMYKRMGFLQEEEAPLGKVPGSEQAIFGLDPDKMDELIQDFVKEMIDAENWLADEREKINKKLQQDLAEIEMDGARQRKKILDDFDEKLSKIDDEERRDRVNTINKYNLDVVQTNRQFALRRAELEAKYRENQIKAEIEYQERLKKLREGFMMDLDEALHERDARQILRLIKQYNLQKEQAGRDYKIQQDEMKRAHELELRELEAQRKERLRILWEELQAKLKAIQEEARLKREAAKADRDAALIELQDRLRKEREIRELEGRQELADLAKRYDDRLTEILTSLTEEYNLTEDMLNKITGLWNDQTGALEKAKNRTVRYINEVNAAILTYTKGIEALARGMANINAGHGVQRNKSAPNTNTRASGGLDVATSPTNLTIGDAGPEVAMTFPLTRAFSGNQYLNGSPVSSLSGGNGEVEIAVSLSPDLVGRIVKQSGDTIANVMLEIQRQR